MTFDQRWHCAKAFLESKGHVFKQIGKHTFAIKGEIGQYPTWALPEEAELRYSDEWYTALAECESPASPEFQTASSETEPFSMESSASSQEMYDASIDAFLIECFRSDAVLTVPPEKVEFVRVLMDPMPLIQTFAFSRLLIQGIDPEAAERYVSKTSDEALADQFDFEDAALAEIHSPNLSR